MHRMRDPETSRALEKKTQARPAWEESLSREIEDLAAAALTFEADWKRFYSPDAFENPLFMRAYAPLVRAHPILAVLRAVYTRSARTSGA
jgi:hypothetical protein